MISSIRRSLSARINARALIAYAIISTALVTCWLVGHGSGWPRSRICAIYAVVVWTIPFCWALCICSNIALVAVCFASNTAIFFLLIFGVLGNMRVAEDSMTGSFTPIHSVGWPPGLWGVVVNGTLFATAGWVYAFALA